FERGTLPFGLVLDTVEELRGPSVLLNLELDLLDLRPVEEQVRVVDSDALPLDLLGRRGGAERRDEEERQSRDGLRGQSLTVHRTLPVRMKAPPHHLRYGP